MMNRMSARLLTALVLSGALLAGCAVVELPSGGTDAAGGVVDLEHWDPRSDGMLRLQGEWEVHRGALLSSNDLRSVQPGREDLVTVPVDWLPFVAPTADAPYNGVATYRMRARSLQFDGALGLALHEVGTSYRLFVDNELLLENGVVASTRGEQVPRMNSNYASFIPPGPDFDIVLQVANFHGPVGGVHQSPVLGAWEQVNDLRRTMSMLEFFLLGCIFIMCVYHVAMYFFARRDLSPLYFSLFCLFIGLRTGLTGERILHEALAWMGYGALVRMEYVVTALAVIAFVLFFKTLYPQEWTAPVLVPAVAASGAMVLFVLVTPLPWGTYAYLGYGVLLIATVVSMLASVAMAIVRGRDRAVIFLFGLLFLLAGTVNDLLYYADILETGYLFTAAAVVFILFQSLLLSGRYADALNRVEDYSTRMVMVNEVKDDFLMRTSQQLKSPLHGMVGIAESIMDGAAGELNEQQKSNLAMIIGSGKRLTNTVNDMLDYSRLLNDELLLETRPVDVREICDVTLFLVRPLIKDKDIRIHNEIPEGFPYVQADEERLQQVLYNVLGNAVKYTVQGSVIVTGRVHDNTAHVTVEDTGIGIPDEMLGTIFEWPARPNGADGAFEQTGMGLPISKRLMQLQGGTVEIDSVVEKGSTVTITIPVSRDQARPTSEESTFVQIVRQAGEEEPVEELEPVAPTNGENGDLGRAGDLRVLVVDDEHINRQVVRNYLTAQHYTVDEARNGVSALEAVSQQRYDAVLLDVMMPRMSGYEVCRELRKSYAAHELPIIMLTSKDTLTDLVQSLSLGANDYISKPFNRTELLARTKTHIQLSKMNLAYSRFVPREFLSLLGKESIVEVALGDQVQKELTILFSDIRAFASLSERLSPKENFDLLNSYLETISPVIRNHQGFIDKYIGDSVMALFPSEPEDALTAALEMKDALNRFNRVRLQNDEDPITIGIGLHTGAMMIGTIGEEMRMEGTVISDAVNLASRLEGLTKLYGGTIIASAAIIMSLPDPSKYTFRFLGLVQVKGKEEVVSIYEVLQDAEEDQVKLNTKDEFERSLASYFKREFRDAARGFYSIMKQNPADYAARLYFRRSQALLAKGCPDTWDGVERVLVK
jgi:two-component system sensor histidine kinase ChiS